MTAPAHLFQPDRWLVLTPETHQALSITWLDRALPDGLYRLRIEKGFVELVSPVALPDRLKALANEGPRRVNVIADRVGDMDLSGLVGLAGQLAPTLEMRLFRWPRDLQAVLDELAMPDAVLRRRAVERARGATATGMALTQPSDWPDHERALSAWQEAAQQSDPDGFKSLYGNATVPWADLLDGKPQPDNALASSKTVRLVARALAATLEGAAELVRQLRQPCLLPAPLALAPAGTRLPDERRHQGGFYTLTVSPALNDLDVFYIHFELDETRAAIGQGRSVTVRIGDANYELGPVDANGLAQLRVLGPLPRGLPIEVNIGGLPQDPAAPDETDPGR